jgi:hypothetical protein
MKIYMGKIPCASSPLKVLTPDQLSMTSCFPKLDHNKGINGCLIGINRDPNTGQFTAASFANFPDELLD